MIYFCASSPAAGWSSLSDGLVLLPMIQRMHQEGARRLNAASFVECGGDLPGSESWEPVEENADMDPRFTAGAYRTQDRLVAVNRPIAEDQPARISEAKAEELFGPLAVKVVQEPGGGDNRLQGEAWRFFVIAMLVFLLVEGLLLIPRAERTQPVASSTKPLKPKMAEEVT